MRMHKKYLGECAAKTAPNHNAVLALIPADVVFSADGSAGWAVNNC